MEDVFIDKKMVARCKKRAAAATNNNRSKRYTDNYSKGKRTLAQSKKAMSVGFMGEVALCLYLGLDPDTAIDWQFEQPDAGYDMIVAGKTIDVKASDNRFATRLMWPVTKRNQMDNLADIFVLTRVLQHKATTKGQTVELCGWIRGDEFVRWHREARGMRGIVDGTPYMDEKDLYSMEQIVQHLGDVNAS